VQACTHLVENIWAMIIGQIKDLPSSSSSELHCSPKLQTPNPKQDSFGKIKIQINSKIKSISSFQDLSDFSRFLQISQILRDLSKSVNSSIFFNFSKFFKNHDFH
jgi:hypothetical protein